MVTRTVTPIVARTRRVPRRQLTPQRRHGAVLGQTDRRALERAGWRTTLEFRENNVRGRDGRLLRVEERWYGEAEHDAGAVFVQAAAGSVDEVWSALRHRVQSAGLQQRGEPVSQAAAQAC